MLGEVIKTSADISEIKSVIDFKPKTNINNGIPKFVNWYKSFYS